MQLRDRINLIPRNNWDYGFREFFAALTQREINVTLAPNTQKLFSVNPIWARSGRAALYAILKSLGLPEGARVGVPLFCCSVVFQAICQAGFYPQFIDSNPDDANISAVDLLEKRSSLAAVVAVHMFGHPCDMDAIIAAADNRPVIEDCAQSIFSTYKGKQTGLLSTASFFSFRCGKYLSAGEGSAIICADTDLHKKIEETVNTFQHWSKLDTRIDALSTYVKTTLYNRPWYGLIGYPIGTRLDKKLNLTAKEGFETGRISPTHLALIEKRIAHFQEEIEIQSNHAQMLMDALIPAKYSVPKVKSDCTSNWFQFALKFQNEEQRDTVAAYLFEHGIDTAKYLNDIADEARDKYGYDGDCPNAERLSKTILLVPIHYKLRDKDIGHLARCINDISLKI